jgi:putative Holliday junction resolvase
MTRYLGVDHGTRRIGLAAGDDGLRIASPVTTIRVSGGATKQAEAVIAAAAEFEFEAFVVGLPTHMDGTEGRQAKRTRRFGRELQSRSGKPVHFVDERLSSRTAQELIQPTELSRRKRTALEDAVAAQVILQQYLDSLVR